MYPNFATNFVPAKVFKDYEFCSYNNALYSRNRRKTLGKKKTASMQDFIVIVLLKALNIRKMFLNQLDKNIKSILKNSYRSYKQNHSEKREELSK